MKKIQLYSLALLAATATLGLTSCGEDFLTEEPSSSVPLEGYYNTEARIRESMVAAYDPMHWYDYNSWSPLTFIWDEMSDDLYTGGGSTSDQAQNHLINQYRSDPRNTIDGAWTASYSGINRSLRLAVNAEQCEALEASSRQAYMDEGYLMRDWYYLMLWKTWGNVPFYLENLSFPYLAEQKTADEIYAELIPDLEQILDRHSLPMKRTGDDVGRMTWAAGAMMYADYVMIQNDESRFAKALGYMKEIINSNQYSLVTGEDYDQLFDYEHEWCPEIIFDINYASHGSVRDWGNAYGMGGTVVPSMFGIDGLSYNGASNEFVGGWGFAAVSVEAYEAFEEGDLRRDVALLNMDEYAERMMKEKNIQVTYGGRYQNTGVFLRKLLGRPGGTEGVVASSDLGWENNMHLYRYAETLLNAAELALRTGDGSAQGYFDQVRSRAGLATKTVSLDNIIDERHVEFVGEGKRYFDLVRTGKAASVLKAGGGKVLIEHRSMQADGTWKGQNVYSESGAAIPERKAWTSRKRYLPIPQGEIESDKSLKQNEEYFD